jgi:hypothetical protein
MFFHMRVLRTDLSAQVEVGHVREIDEIFDAISYKKGAAIIRMLQTYLGAESFQVCLFLHFYVKCCCPSNFGIEAYCMHVNGDLSSLLCNRKVWFPTSTAMSTKTPRQKTCGVCCQRCLGSL